MAQERKLWVVATALAVVVIIIVAAAAVIVVNSQSASSAGKIPPEMKTYATDWPLPNKDYNNSRATTSSTINSQNVMNLGPAWQYKITGFTAFGGATCTPIIIGTTVLFQDGKSNILALDLNTGAVKWSKMYNSSKVAGPNGVCVAYGKVFATKDPWNVAALDLNTGDELWSSNLSAVASTGIDIQPLAYDNKIFTSTVPGTGDIFYKGGGMGIIYALDQATGHQDWSFNTVKDGYLWGNATVNSGGGCWYPPAVDTKTGIIYYGVGNPAPFAGAPGYPSGSSFDAALYTNSILAIDHNNGNLKWYSQANTHDIWDHDLQISPILARANISGVHQDIVLAAGKMGNVYAMNRETGAKLWVLPVGLHANDTTDPIAGPTEVLPGVLGGVETCMAYSDGMLFVPVIDLPTTYTPTGIDFASLNFGAGKGEFVAINVDYGHIVWKKNYQTINVGGATVSNDVVFTASFDGTIHAYKTTTGDELWTFKAPSGINGWPAIAGDTIVWPCGVGGVPALVAFKLNTGPTVKITSPADGSTVLSPDITVNVDVARFNLVNKLGQASVAGEGHLHYFLDVAPPTTLGQPAVTANGTFAATTSTSYNWTNLAAGQHMLSVELVNNDHTPLDPPIVATVFVTVGVANPLLTITYPPDGGMVHGSNVTISVSVVNFNLVDKLGETNVTGEGHIHYFLDVTPATTPDVPAFTANGTFAATANTSYTWTNVSVGMHMFSAELVNNDHTPLAPPVTAFANVTVMNATGNTTIWLSAHNIAFNMTTITVAAGNEVTVVFENDDSGIPHNFAVYTDSSATTVIYQGTQIVGVATITYTFAAPATPGTYFFRCDVHPTQMNGSFVVT